MEVNKNLYCKICDRYFVKNSGLAIHMERLHRNRKPCKPLKSGPIGKRKRGTSGKVLSEKPFKFTCDLCGDGFKNYGGLHSHMRAHDLRKSIENKDIRYLCKICGLEFNRKFQLTNHARLHNSNMYNKEKRIECNICGNKFQEMAMLIVHKRSHTGERPFKCQSCDMRFSSKGRLSNHTRWKHAGSVKKFKCGVCDKKFHFRSSLDKHKGTHSADTSYECEICSHKFKGKVGYQSHMKSHTGENLFVCKVCGNTYSTASALKSHMNRHTKEKLYKCDICTKVFLCNGNLTKHRRIHFDEAPYKCEVCGKGFKQNSGMHTHMETHKPEHLKKRRYPKGFKRFSCEVCKRAFVSKCSLQTHMRLHNGDVIECEICKKIFMSNKQFVIHKRGHTGEITHTCEICGRGFACKEYYLKHYVTIHQGVRKWQCDECGARFTQCCALQRHRKVHTGERPFPCTECDKKYRDKHSLQLHMRYHTGELVKSFICTICKKGFTRNWGLELHMRTIHKGSHPYRCEICQRTFSTKGNLSKHLACNHAFERKYKCKCEICGKKFWDSKGLKQHTSIVHDKIYPYECSICHKEFSSASNLKNHLLTHVKYMKKEDMCPDGNADDNLSENQAQYQCKVCDKSYSSIRSLARHVANHEESEKTVKNKSKKKSDQQFVCILCCEKFKSETDLKTHIVTHVFEMKKDKIDAAEMNNEEVEKKKKIEEETQYVCGICNQGFPCESDLRQHMNSHKNNKIDINSYHSNENVSNVVTPGNASPKIMSSKAAEKTNIFDLMKEDQENIVRSNDNVCIEDNQIISEQGQKIDIKHSKESTSNTRTNIFEDIFKMEKTEMMSSLEPSESFIRGSHERLQNIDKQVNTFHENLKKRKKGQQSALELNSDEEILFRKDSENVSKLKTTKNIFDEMFKGGCKDEKSMLVNGVDNSKIKIAVGKANKKHRACALSNVFDQVMKTRLKELKITLDRKEVEEFVGKQKKTKVHEKINGHKNIFDELIKYNAELRSINRTKELDKSEIIILDDSDDTIVESAAKDRIVELKKQNADEKNKTSYQHDKEIPEKLNRIAERLGENFAIQTEPLNKVSKTSEMDIELSEKLAIQSKFTERKSGISDKHVFTENSEIGSEISDKGSRIKDKYMYNKNSEKKEKIHAISDEQSVIPDKYSEKSEKYCETIDEHSDNLDKHCKTTDQHSERSDKNCEKANKSDDIPTENNKESQLNIKTAERKENNAVVDCRSIQDSGNESHNEQSDVCMEISVENSDMVKTHIKDSQNNETDFFSFGNEEFTVLDTYAENDTNNQVQCSDKDSDQELTHCTENIEERISVDSQNDENQVHCNSPLICEVECIENIDEDDEPVEEEDFENNEALEEVGIDSHTEIIPPCEKQRDSEIELASDIKVENFENYQVGLNENSLNIQMENSCIENCMGKQDLDHNSINTVLLEDEYKIELNTMNEVEHESKDNDAKYRSVLGPRSVKNKHKLKKKVVKSENIDGDKTDQVNNNEKLKQNSTKGSKISMKCCEKEYKQKDDSEPKQKSGRKGIFIVGKKLVLGRVRVRKEKACEEKQKDSLNNPENVKGYISDIIKKEPNSQEETKLREKSLDRNFQDEVCERTESPTMEDNIKTDHEESDNQILRKTTKMSLNSSDPFHCDMCEQTFKTKKSLRSHKMTHTENYLFSCQACGKGFYWEDHLERHMNIHLKSSTYVDLLKSYSSMS